MKRLFVARHAKSSWDDPDLPDHDRPLNKRGKRVAPKMGEYLTEQRALPDQIVSSTAVRAARTAEAFARAFRDAGRHVTVEFTRDLYHASAEELLELVGTLAPESENVLIVGHNPGLENFLAELCNLDPAERFPTCAVAVVEFSVSAWTEVQAQTGKLLNVWLPKELDL